MEKPKTEITQRTDAPQETAPTATHWNPRDLKLIKNTVAKGTTDDEFREFIEVCRLTRLNPFKREIYCLIFNAGKPDKRQVVFVVSIGGYRTIAQRNGDYLGIKASDAPVVERSEEAIDPDQNPLGFVEATVKVWRRLGPNEYWDNWGVARWDELAPMYWDKSNGKRVLKDGFWKTMPELMLIKCAEAQAIRRAWPSDFNGLHVEDEFDRAVADEDVIEAIEHQETEDRLEKAAVVANTFSLVFDPADPIEPVPQGEVVSRAEAYLRSLTPNQALAWKEKNRAALREFFLRHKTDGKEVNRLIEQAAGKGGKEPAQEAAEEEAPEPEGVRAADQEASPPAATADTDAIPDEDEEPAAHALWLTAAILGTTTREAAEKLWDIHSDAVHIDLCAQVEDDYLKHWESLRS